MFLISKRLFFLNVFLIFLFLLVLATVGFQAIRLQYLTKADLKLLSENYLFFCVVGIIGFIIITSFLLMQSLNVNSVLDKIIDQTQNKNYDPTNVLKRLGSFGKKLNLIYNNLNSLNEKKSLKIGSMNKLMHFLVYYIGTAQHPLMICDLIGQILYMTDPFPVEAVNDMDSDPSTKHIHDYFPFVTNTKIIYDLEKKNAPVLLENEGNTIEFHPIYNQRGLISYILILYNPTLTINYSYFNKPVMPTKSPRGVRFKKIYDSIFKERHRG